MRYAERQCFVEAGNVVRMKEFNKILVPTDYSELSIAAMDYALTFSHLFGSRIFLLHTLDTIPVLALHAVDLTTETVIFETERNARNDLHLFTVSYDLSKARITYRLR